MRFRIKFVEGVGYYPQVELTTFVIFSDWYNLYKWQGKIDVLSKDDKDHYYVDEERAKNVIEEYNYIHNKKPRNVIYNHYFPG